MIQTITRITLIVFLVLLIHTTAHTQKKHQPFQSNETLTWSDCIAQWKTLDSLHADAELVEIGVADCGKMMHLFVINKEKKFRLQSLSQKKNIVLINNAIHPGEPDGVDASLMLCRELLDTLRPIHKLLDSLVVCVIPMYNIDGALRRNNHTRANQDGPASYGFRGNAKNLDLNRDFIKCDSKNALFFNSVFTFIQPTVLIDTHVSDGADYPYTMTLITTGPGKLGSHGDFLKNVIEKQIYKSMEEMGDPICPYVTTVGSTPETGIEDFYESPRYSTGYGALYGTYGFVTESHMLKPYAQRVESTYRILLSILETTWKNNSSMLNFRSKWLDEMKTVKRWPLNYIPDTTRWDTFHFHGYTAEVKPALVGKGERIFYNHNKPWNKDIRWYRYNIPIDSVDIPDYYLLPQAYTEVMERLRANGVKFYPCQKDTSIEIVAQFFDQIKSLQQPYEAHYYHENFKISERLQKVTVYKGDWIIPVNGASRRYLIETMEAKAVDSFFRWNFFDAALQQKEWYSDYVFEEKAKEILDANKPLREAFDLKMKTEYLFAENHREQLTWIYRQSKYFEGTAFMNPVLRLNKKTAGILGIQ
jgi:hypothetical protein